MTDQMNQVRDEKARTYGYNNAIYIDKAMLNKEGYQYLEEKPAKDFKEGTDWYRNNVWHDVKERPVFDRRIAYIDVNGYICTINPTRFNWMAVHRAILLAGKGWAYIEDLLPD